VVPTTSGLPRTTDIVSARRHVSNVPVADSRGATWLSIHAFRRSCN
jgi:hypothetical protein